MRRIYLTAYNTYIYEWERKYADPYMEYDGASSLRLVEPDRDGNDPADPCADDLRKDGTLQRKIWNWAKKGVKPRTSKRKKR
jgi:hypothetical protein